MDEGRKRVLAIVAGILVARHLKTTDNLFDCRSSPRTESLVAAGQFPERAARGLSQEQPSVYCLDIAQTLAICRSSRFDIAQLHAICRSSPFNGRGYPNCQVNHWQESLA
jgi:hypothetical protein